MLFNIIVGIILREMCLEKDLNPGPSLITTDLYHLLTPTSIPSTCSIIQSTNILVTVLVIKWSIEYNNNN